MPKKSRRIHSRPPMERMMQIHHRIHSGAYPNSTQLAKEIEVTTRTIKRDVDFMKTRLELPIDYNSRRYGYYYTKPVDQFPSIPITEVEVFALLIADKAVAQYHGTPWHQPLEAAFRRLMGQLNQESSLNLDNLDSAFSFRPLAPEEANVKMFQKLTQSMQEQRSINFQYRNLGMSEAKQRHVYPYHVACVDSHWYLFAFDVDRQAMRTFALSRVHDLVLMRKQFKKPATFNLDEYLKGSFGVLKGTADYEVVVDFDAWATDLLLGRRWHSSQEFTLLPEGRSRLRMRLTSVKEVERFVLSFGAHARVVQPPELLTRMRDTVQALVKYYA